MIRKVVVSATQRLPRVSSRQRALARKGTGLLLFDASSVGKYCHNSSISKRPVSSLALHAWDMIRSASLSPPNPLLEQDVNFEQVRPHHLVGAAKQVRQEYLDSFERLEQTLSDDDSNADITAETLLEKLEELEAPLDYVHNAAALYQSLMQTPDFDYASHQVAMILDDKPHEQSYLIMETLTRLDKKLQEHDESSTAVAIRRCLNRFRSRGVNHEEQESFLALQDALDTIEARFVKYSDFNSRTTTRQKLEDMYSMISIKSQLAKLLGYQNAAEYILAAENRLVTSPEDVTSLHNLVKERFSDENTKPLLKYDDTQSYLSLNGVLLGTFGLIRALFGITFLEADTPRGWSPDVRLFLATEEATGEELGKLYLDPFFRGTKARNFFLSPLDRNSVFLAAPIKAPAWDDQPTPLNFQDALSLVHEFGHVLQFLLAKNPPAIATQHMPQDFSEVMPQFLEHFMVEEPFLQTLAHLSGAAEPMPLELVNTLQAQRVADKIQVINQRAFLGQLELELFSGRDESLVSLQRRLAKEYVPHDLPDKNDIASLFRIMSDNANGRNMCRYRYLWGECMSADMYTLFQEAGMEDEETMRELGMRLRKTILEPGGLVDMSAFSKFRGREMSCDALFAMYNDENALKNVTEAEES